MIFPVPFMIIPFCMAQIHPEQWTIPVVSDEHGNLWFGGPSEQNDNSWSVPYLPATTEQNETAQVQSPLNEPQDEVSISVDLSRELLLEVSPFHVSQPQAIRTNVTDQDIESLSAALYHPVYALMHSNKDHQNMADHEAYQREVFSTLFQLPVTTDADTESIDTDLGTLLACGDLGPLSVDSINVDPFVDMEMEILLNNTSRASNASMTCVEHQLNTSKPRGHLQVSPASFDFINKNDQNVREQRDTNLACPGFSGSAHGQSVRSVRTNSDQTLLQSGFFKYHFANQTSQKIFKCDMCQKLFHSSGGYQKHRRIHADQKPFQCDICSKQFRTSYNHQRHRRIHTGEMPFQCDLCPRRFRASSDFHTHRRIHTGEKPFLCDACPKRFPTSSDFLKHRRMHTGEKPYQCDICLKQFCTSSNCHRHRRSHTGKKSFQCDICPKQFHTSDNYQRHRRIHTAENPFKCDFCQKKFSDASNYQIHRRIHTGEKPFQCEICQKQFCTSGSYQRHRRTHNRERMFRCDICTKQFRTSNNYQKHRRKHADETRFKCDFCQKKFNDQSNYQKHQIAHTGRKPYQCEMCMKQFRYSGEYKTHRRTHTREKPFQCDACLKEFRTSSSCQRHRQTHTIEKSHICYWCGRGYCSKRNLVQHVRKCPSRNVSHTADPVVLLFMDSGTRKWTYMQ